jgi:hypothetical protein
MTSAAKHMASSHKTHMHFITSRNYQDKPSRQAGNVADIMTAISRRPEWFWNIISYIQKAYSSTRTRYRV